MKVECDRVASVIGGNRDRMKIAAAEHLFRTSPKSAPRRMKTSRPSLLPAKRLLRSAPMRSASGSVRRCWPKIEREEAASLIRDLPTRSTARRSRLVWTLASGRTRLANRRGERR